MADQPLCVRPWLCRPVTHRKHQQVIQLQLWEGFYTLVSVQVICPAEQRGNPWPNCFPLHESMSSKVVSEDSKMCWRGRRRCWIRFVWCETPDGGWTLQIVLTTMTNAPVDWIRSVCLHLCVCAGVKSNSIMRSIPSLPIKVIDATPELPQRRGCKLGSR